MLMFGQIFIVPVAFSGIIRVLSMTDWKKNGNYNGSKSKIHLHKVELHHNKGVISNE